MITIYDVAQKAGVSIATVSYALNNKKNVSKEKKQIIIRIAEEMGYVPNSLAKGLHEKKTNIIGLIGMDISTPYFSTLVLHLERHARQNGYFLLLGITTNDREVEQVIIERFISKNVDALILAPPSEYTNKEMYHRYQTIVSRINKLKIPFLCLDSYLSGITTNFIMSDLEEGEYLAARHLLDNGHSDILFVGGWHKSTSTIPRHNGMKKALEEVGITWDSTNFLDCGYKFQEGYLGILRYLETNPLLPSAILAINDSVAFGIYKGLKERGIRVPADISLIGYDDVNLPTIDAVPLTTVKIPLDEMSKLTIETITRGQEEKNVIHQYTLKPQLIIRESVKKLGTHL